MGSYPRAPDRPSLAESLFSCPLDERHLAEALRYVELNHVRARLVEDPCEWAWSSAPARINGTDPYELLRRRSFRDVAYGEAANRDLSYSFPRKCFFKPGERQSIHHIARFQPPAPGHGNPVLHVILMLDLV